MNLFNDYEYDRFQYLDLRVVLGGRVGYIAWMGETAASICLAARPGAARVSRVRNHRPTRQPCTFRSESRGSILRGRFHVQNDGVTALYQSARLFPNLSKMGEYRLNFDIGANTKPASWLVGNIAISDRFLSNPVYGFSGTICCYTTGIGVNVRKINAETDVIARLLMLASVVQSMSASCG